MPNPPTLKNLNQAFDNIWLNTAQMPTLLDKWQQLVSEYLFELEPNEQNLAEFERHMDHWQTVLEENRQLLEDYQGTLKDKIREGEANPLSAGKVKKYQK